MERKKRSDYTSEDPGIDSKKRKSSDKKSEVRDLSENKSDQPQEKTSKIVGYFNDLVKIGTKSMKGKSGREKIDDTEMDELLADVEKKIAEAENVENENLAEKTSSQSDRPRISTRPEKDVEKTLKKGLDLYVSSTDYTNIEHMKRITQEIAENLEKPKKKPEFDLYTKNKNNTSNDYEIPTISKETQNQLKQAILAFDAKNPLVIPVAESKTPEPSVEFRSSSVGGNDKRSDLDEINKLPKEITKMGNQWISDSTRQRGPRGKYYEHIKHAKTSEKISSEDRAYISEFKNTLNRINSPEQSKAVIAGFDTTVLSVGTPGSDMREPVGKDNPRHTIEYEIPPGEEGVFKNGKRTIKVEEIWGSGQKSKLKFDESKKEWVIDPLTLETGIDSNTRKTRPLHTGEIINPENNHIIPDPEISQQVRLSGEKFEIDGKEVPEWKPYPKTGVGMELAHTSDRYPRALTKHYLKYNDVNRKETVRLLSRDDHRLLEDDQKNVRDYAQKMFMAEKLQNGKILDLKDCYHEARKDKELKPRFNNDNTYPPMDYESKWRENRPDDEMPKSYGKPYGDKTLNEINKSMEKIGIHGATSGTDYYYAGSDPEEEKRFNEYLEGKLQKVEIKGEFKDLAPEQQFVLIKSREIAEYMNKYFYHPLFGKMRMKKDTGELGMTQKNLEDSNNKWSGKLSDFTNALDKYKVPKSELILPIGVIGTSIAKKKLMNDEFVKKNSYPVFDYNESKNFQPKIATATNLPQDKIEELKEPVKLIKEAQNYSELAKLSADAFNSSFFAHPIEIDGYRIRGTLKHYQQSFKGFYGYKNGNFYELPAGTKHHHTQELREIYDKFWDPIIQRNKQVKIIDNKLKLLENYHREISQDPVAVKSLDVRKYELELIKDISTQIKDFEPIQEAAFSNFKNVYNYIGEPWENENNIPKTVEVVWDLFKKSDEKFRQLKNKFSEN